MDLAALKSELLTDPTSRGYAGKLDDACADLLNRLDRQANRETLTAGQILSAVVRAEFDSLGAAAKNYVTLVLGVSGEIPMTTQLRTDLGAIFGAGTATRANLAAIVKRTASRGEELGLGIVSASDVANARRT